VPLAVRRVLAHLALRGPSSRRELAAQLWPEASEPHAAGSLRTSLWRVRALHPRLLTCDVDTVELSAQVVVDVRELARDVRALRSGHLSDGLLAVPETLCEGELLPGWYDDWLVLERERVRQLRLHALEAVAGALSEEGAHALAVEAAYAAVRADPLRESAHRVLIAVHLREGNRSEAVRQYWTCRDLLARELGVRPSAHLDELLGASRTGRPDRAVPLQARGDAVRRP
jgi:DNA-binding SARP family transcriptional activator